MLSIIKYILLFAVKCIVLFSVLFLTVYLIIDFVGLAVSFAVGMFVLMVIGILSSSTKTNFKYYSKKQPEYVKPVTRQKYEWKFGESESLSKIERAEPVAQLDYVETEAQTESAEPVAQPEYVEPVSQLEHVKTASFKRKPLINKMEFEVFKKIEKEVKNINKQYRVFVQVNLGEFISADNDTFKFINCKRVDFLIADIDENTNESQRALLAIEYQGKGHHIDDAAIRDEIKKIALEKAGIGYIEIFPDDDDNKIRTKITTALKIYLHVPYPEKNKAKKLGAKWD